MANGARSSPLPLGERVSGEGYPSGARDDEIRSMGNERAKRLRSRSTDAERKLWSRLRNRQLAGAKFRRQVPIGRYVVDFICFEAALVVEVDGGQHAARVDHDVARTAWLEREGYRVVRFWNNDVLQNIEGVLLEVETRLAAG
jgi:very-short-patch-repair endonuclease